MKLIYLSGKITTKFIWMKVWYYLVALYYARKLWQERDCEGNRAYIVYSPYWNTAFIGNKLTYNEWIEADLKVIEKCDEIHMLPNWRTSKGANTELEYAIKLEKTVRYL